MPIPVKLWFVGYLMQYSLLRVKHIVFESDFIEDMGSRGILPSKELSEMRVIDLVSELVGLEGESLSIHRRSSFCSGNLTQSVPARLQRRIRVCHSARSPICNSTAWR